MTKILHFKGLLWKVVTSEKIQDNFKIKDLILKICRFFTNSIFGENFDILDTDSHIRAEMFDFQQNEEKIA